LLATVLPALLTTLLAALSGVAALAGILGLLAGLLAAALLLTGLLLTALVLLVRVLRVLAHSVSPWEFLPITKTRAELERSGGFAVRAIPKLAARSRTIMPQTRRCPVAVKELR
jgi:hypothetical protein